MWIFGSYMHQINDLSASIDSFVSQPVKTVKLHFACISDTEPLVPVNSGAVIAYYS